MLYTNMGIFDGKISKIISQLSKTGEIIEKDPIYISQNECAVIEFAIKKTIDVDKYKDVKMTGRVIML